MARSEMAKKRQKERSDNSCDGPQLSAQEKKQRAELSELEIEEQRTFAPILHRLAEAGFPAESLEDFSERYSPLPSAAVEILLVSIPEFGGDERAKEMIVRELADVAEPFEGSALVECFEGTTDPSLRFAVLNTIACARPHSIEGWLRVALRDTWIKKMLLLVGRTVHRRRFDEYLRAAEDQPDPSDADRSARGGEEATRYKRVYGPMLSKLAKAGFEVHSVEELPERYGALPSAAVDILLSSLASLDEKAKPLILQTLQKAAGPFDGRPLAACYDSTSDKLVRNNALLTIAATKLHSIDEWLNGLDPQTKKKLKALRYLA